MNQIFTWIKAKVLFIKKGRDKSVSHKVKYEQYRYGNILRFPRAAGELPRAIALRDLTDASSPAGVFVYFLRLFSESFVFYDHTFVLSQPLLLTLTLTQIV